MRLTTLPPSCAEYLEIWEPQPPGTLRACTGIALILRVKRLNKIGHIPSANYIAQQKHWVIFRINFNKWFLRILFTSDFSEVAVSIR